VNGKEEKRAYILDVRTLLSPVGRGLKVRGKGKTKSEHLEN